jgi:geranylgeranyl pyrophosphate synthase
MFNPNQWDAGPTGLTFPSWIHLMRLHDVGLCPTQSGSITKSLAAVETLIANLIECPDTSVDGLPSTAAQAAARHLTAGGKRIRARLALHAALACDMKDTDGVVLAAVSELLHNASLVHDDIQDQTPTRRGFDALWASHGVDVALCAGDLMLSAAYAALAGLSDTTRLPALLMLIHNRTSVAIRGQCADLAADAADKIDVPRYEAIAVAKSGALLGLSLEIVFTASGNEALSLQARIAVEHFAIGYQIADDIVDLADDVRTQKVALNIVPILGGGASALFEARWLAQRHLRAAAAAALGLPHGAGNLLRDLALRLAATLSPVAAS